MVYPSFSSGFTLYLTILVKFYSFNVFIGLLLVIWAFIANISDQTTDKTSMINY